VVIENWAMSAIARLGRRWPSRVPALARFIASKVGRSVKTDRSYKVYASQRRVRFTEMEYAIPRAHAAEAVRRVLEIAAAADPPVVFPIEVRFVAGDDSHLSPAHERDTTYIAVHQFEGVAWEGYFRSVEAVMNEYEGRPHWGKRHFQSAETLAARYPHWDAFREVRERLDPEGAFRNEYTDRVLGPVGAPTVESA